MGFADGLEGGVVKVVGRTVTSVVCVCFVWDGEKVVDVSVIAYYPGTM